MKPDYKRNLNNAELIEDRLGYLNRLDPNSEAAQYIQMMCDQIAPGIRGLGDLGVREIIVALLVYEPAQKEVGTPDRLWMPK